MNTLKAILLFILSDLAVSYKFSDSFKVCHKNDPNINKCLVDAIQKGFELLGHKGQPEIGIPPIDPIFVEKLTIGAGSSAVKLVQYYTDIKIHGLSNLTVENAKIDNEKLHLTFTTRHPLLSQISQYEVNGKVLVLPVVGKGDAKLDFYNLKIVHDIEFEVETRKNKQYGKVKKYAVDLTPDRVHSYLENLFNGDKKLSETILKTINENWSVIFNDVKIGYDQSYGKVFESVAANFLRKIPIEDLLPN